MANAKAALTLASGKPAAVFATTAWTVVRAAGADASGPAMQVLCQSYWQPVFGFLRRRGMNPSDAEDACQSFFAWLLESEAVGRADAGRGRFRDFLLAATRQFLAREYRHRGAAKRCPPGGLVSIDAGAGERRYALDPVDDNSASPDERFDADWALSLLDRATARLRQEWVGAGRPERFEALRSFLTDGADAGGRQAAGQLGMTEGAFRVAVHRMKRRFGEVLREEVAQTLDAGEDVDAELSYLRLALGRSREGSDCRPPAPGRPTPGSDTLA